MGILASAVLGKTLEKAVEAIADVAKAGRTAKVKVEQSRARECVMAHVQSVGVWASSISLQSLLRDKRLRDSFVELGFDVGLVRQGGGRQTRGRQAGVTLEDVFASGGHVVILGRPGAGKTTSLQRAAQLALDAWERGDGGVPVLVRLRDLRADESLVSHLLGLLGISVQVPHGSSADFRRGWELRTVLAYLASVSAVLLLDGLDERGEQVRVDVNAEIRDLALAPGGHRLLATCRIADCSRRSRASRCCAACAPCR